MRKRIFEIIEVAGPNDIGSKIYDVLMMIVIFASLIPLMFKDSYDFFDIFDYIAAFAFIVDYILRFATADFKLKKGVLSFALYPLTFMAIVDMLCILPSLTLIHKSFRVLRIFRLFMAFRVFKFLRYSKSINTIINVIKSQRVPLIAVCSITFAYILVAALVVFNIEPDTFNNFFDALYWATVSLTTIGYGDITPVSLAGKIFTMISTVVGVALIALPSSIITAGFIHELSKTNDPEGALNELEGYVKL